MRHAHTATHYVCDGRSYIVVYGTQIKGFGPGSLLRRSPTPGGYDGEMREPTTTHIFDVENRCWVEGAISDQYTPAARSFHTATYVCVDNEPYLFVVGGLHMRIGGDGGDSK